MSPLDLMNNLMPGVLLGSDPEEHVPDAFIADAFKYFPDTIVLADGEARVAYLNPAAEQLLGQSLKNAHGHGLDNVLRLQDGLTRLPLQISDFCSQASPSSKHANTA